MSEYDLAYQARPEVGDVCGSSKFVNRQTGDEAAQNFVMINRGGHAPKLLGIAGFLEFCS